MNSHDIYNLSEAYLDVYSQVAELDEANKGDEYAASKVHPIFARSIKQQRRNASFDSGATHSKAPRMTSGQQSEIENMPNGGPAEVSRQKTLMRQRYTRNMRGVKPKKGNKAWNRNEEIVLYDLILSHLLDEGYAETPEAAEVIMVNMSEDWRESIVEATAMAKRGYDEAPIRKKIAANTGGGESADRATKLASRPTYGDSNKKRQRENLARKQRGNFRDTTSSNPGLHGYAYKSDDSTVRAKQSARGAQRGVLTPNEKSALNR